MMNFLNSLCALLLFSLAAWASPCAPLSDTEKSQLQAFIHAWYKLPDDQAVVLVGSSMVDECYIQLSFRTKAPAPLLTLYLTPDRKHLVSTLMNLSVDPAVTRRKKQQELAERLASGALLLSGNPLSPVKMVVFGDFQCPYCKQFSKIVGGLPPEEKAGVEIIYRQLPLKIHPWASDAAKLSACVALQDVAAFWKLHDFLFEEQEELTQETLPKKSLEFLSRTAEVDGEKVKLCMASAGFESSLQADALLAQDLGISSTPTIFVNGRRVAVRSMEDLRRALRDAGSEAEAPDGKAAVRVAGQATR